MREDDAELAAQARAGIARVAHRQELTFSCYFTAKF
jgi:hypothetical protein